MFTWQEGHLVFGRARKLRMLFFISDVGMFFKLKNRLNDDDIRICFTLPFIQWDGKPPPLVSPSFLLLPLHLSFICLFVIVP